MANNLEKAKWASMWKTIMEDSSEWISIKIDSSGTNTMYKIRKTNGSVFLYDDANNERKLFSDSIYNDESMMTSDKIYQMIATQIQNYLLVNPFAPIKIVVKAGSRIIFQVQLDPKVFTQKQEVSRGTIVADNIMKESTYYEEITNSNFSELLYLNEIRLLKAKIKLYQRNVSAPEALEAQLVQLFEKIKILAKKWGISNHQTKIEYVQEYSHLEQQLHALSNVPVLSKRLSHLETNPSQEIQLKIETLSKIEKLIASIKGRPEVTIWMRKQMNVFLKAPELLLQGFPNIILTGNPGTGKTYIAGLIAKFCGMLGLLHSESGYIHITSRADFVAGFVGQTVAKTRSLLTNCLEKVIFLDEAYSLPGCGADGFDSYGLEAIHEIVNFLDKNMGKCFFIAAGYEDHMKSCFLESNPGLNRRFPVRFRLKDYEPSALWEIFIQELRNLNTGITVKTSQTNQETFMKFTFHHQAGSVATFARIFAEQLVLATNIQNLDSLLLAAYEALMQQEKDYRISNFQPKRKRSEMSKSAKNF